MLVINNYKPRFSQRKQIHCHRNAFKVNYVWLYDAAPPA